jgi:hypothetical protein
VDGRPGAEEELRSLAPGAGIEEDGDAPDEVMPGEVRPGRGLLEEGPPATLSGLLHREEEIVPVPPEEEGIIEKALPEELETLLLAP